jgi:hypothetical protein
VRLPLLGPERSRPVTSHRIDIAASMAAAARTIDNTDTLEQTLHAIVRGAQRSVPGIDHVGITTVDRGGKMTTRAATDEVVGRLDSLQYSLNEGPCLDALRNHLVVAAPHLAHEKRWPGYVSAALRGTGLKAQLAAQLYLDDGSSLGALNMYVTERADIDAEAESIAGLFAAHAAVALGKARQIDGLYTALLSRKTNGQALGILMERYRISADAAFAFLSRASSRSNVKLRQIAQEIVEETSHYNDSPDPEAERELRLPRPRVPPDPAARLPQN